MAMICEIDEQPPAEYHVSSRKTTGISLFEILMFTGAY